MALTVEDKLEILELMARYSHAADFQDLAGWLSTWTDDGAFENPWGRFEGREGLASVIERFWQDFPGGRHWTNNVIIEGDGEAATATSYLHTMQVGDSVKTAGTGRYRDRLEKIDGRWLFKERVVVVD